MGTLGLSNAHVHVNSKSLALTVVPEHYHFNTRFKKQFLQHLKCIAIVQDWCNEINASEGCSGGVCETLSEY